MIVVPKVMGKAMGMNPALLLLSLSVWGTLLGFIGLIIALPLTTIIMAYWKRYVSGDVSLEPGQKSDHPNVK
jgi:predicted PurR-regulated permease PerM